MCEPLQGAGNSASTLIGAQGHLPPEGYLISIFHFRSKARVIRLIVYIALVNLLIIPLWPLLFH